MNIDVSRLGCTTDKFKELMYILKSFGSSHCYFLAMKGMLEMVASNDGVTSDHLVVKIPYTGKRMEGFVLTNTIGKVFNGFLPLTTVDKPKKWPVARLACRPTELHTLDGAELNKTLDYVLRVRDIEFLMVDSQMWATNGSVSHYAPAAGLHAPVSEVFGLKAALCLQNTLRRFNGARVYGGYQNIHGAYGFFVKITDGNVKIFVTSGTEYSPEPKIPDRPPGLNNSSVTFYRDHMMEVLRYALNKGEEMNKFLSQRKVRGEPYLFFVDKPDSVEAFVEVHYCDEKGQDQTATYGEPHKLLCRKAEVATHLGRVRADLLNEAVRGLGNNVCVTPTNTESVYVSGEYPGFFALVGKNRKVVLT